MRGIKTSDDFVYDVLSNLIHHNEIVVNKTDINLSLQSILGRLKDDLTIADNGTTISIKKSPDLRYRLLFRQIKE